MIPGFIMMTAYQSIHQKFRKTGHFKVRKLPEPLQSH